MGLTRTLYRAARLSNDGRAIRRSIQTGSVRPVARRARNKMIGRVFGRTFGKLYRL